MSRAQLMQPSDSGQKFQIAIAGVAPRAELHTGGFATTTRAWAILAAPFENDPCNGQGESSCGQAMAVRAFMQAHNRHLLPRDKPFTLITDSIDLACLMIEWQDGNTDPPPWYHRPSRRSSIVRAQQAVAKTGKRMTVHCVPVDALPPVGQAARAMAFIGKRYLLGQISSADQFDEGQLALREAGL